MAVRLYHQPFVAHLTAAEIKLAEMQKNLALKNFYQCHSTVNFWQQVPESRGVTRLSGARGKQQVWHPHVWTWDLSKADVLSWIKYLWYCWDFAAPSAVIRRPPQWFGDRRIVPPLSPSLRSCQKVNNQNIKDQCTTYFCIQHDILLWILFLCNEVRKIKPLCNNENEHLGEIICTSSNVLSRFSGTRKSIKNLILTMTIHHLM